MIYSNNNIFNTNNLKNNYLYYQYNNIGQQKNNNNLNMNNKNISNNNLKPNCIRINPLNKITPRYYSTKLKDKILNNLRVNFQENKINNKKKFYMLMWILM